MSLKAMLDKRRNGQGGALLKGSDVPSGTKSITIEVAGVRESPPEFGAPLILDFKKPLYGKSSLAINKTNAKGLARQFGDDENLLVGKRVKFDVISVRNPQSGDIVPSLAISPRQ